MSKNLVKRWSAGLISLFSLTLIFLMISPSLSWAQTPENNVILLKLTDAAVSRLNVRVVNDIVRTGISSFDAWGEQFKLEKMERIFPPAGKFETRRQKFSLHRFYKLTFAAQIDLDSVMQLFKSDVNTELVQVSRRYTLYREKKDRNDLNFTPNDPLYPNQWHYNNTGQTGGTPDADIDAPEAWDIETGDPAVIVSDLDTGQDLDHPDLLPNLWVNLGEIPANGLDDDGNGYIDDINGWDFSDGDNVPDDYHDHGSHTGGTVAAKTNNGIGVAGVAGGASPGVQIMACKIFPNATDVVIAEAFTYAADNGSIVSTNSWGNSFPGPPSPVIEAAIDYFLTTSDGIVIFAAGNDNTNDATWGYPASYPPVVAVAATDHNDVKASFSNWGDWVDVSAPGVNVLSTIRGAYGTMSGTSMACPHAAGVAALLFSANPGWTGAQVRAQLEASTDNIDALNPGFEGLLGTGRINAHKSLSGGPFPNPPTNLQLSAVGNDVDLTWDDPTENTDGSPINLDFISVYRDGAEIAQVGAGVQSYSDLGVPDGQHSYYVTAHNIEGEEGAPSNVENVLIGTFDVLIWQHPDVTQVNIETKAASRGLSISEVRAMVRAPRSSQAIQDALTANGKSSVIVGDLTGLDLSQYEAFFGVLGIFPNNHVIPANSDEALAIENYILNGGKAYLEGGDMWAYDPAFGGGHDFGPLFGISGLDDGVGDLNTILGVAGTFTEGLDFTYSGENNYIDRLASLPPAFTIHQNASPPYDCGIAHDPTTYKTIGNSFEFEGLDDVLLNQTKEGLMAVYLQFLDVPVGAVDAVVWIPGDVIEPNFVQKASQRNLTLEQVQSLKVQINSHEELKAALEANGRSVQIVNDLITVDLSAVNYLFVVLGIYPNNHVIEATDPEVSIIDNFRASGGKVYMEGGDMWYYDPLNLNGHNFAPDFGIDPQADGVNDLKTVLGACSVENLDFVYKGVNNFIDHIGPNNGGCQFHSNLVPLYGCGVGNDPGGLPRTIGLSFQFGGLDDISLSPATKVELMANYLEFLDGGIAECQITVLAPNGGELIPGGSLFEIQWTSINTSGSVTLEFSTDGGATFNLIAASEADDGSFDWLVPNVLSNDCLVRITDASDPGCSDQSDDLFSIVGPSWLAPISVNAVGGQTNDLEITNFDLAFGGHPDATDGFDPGLDIVAAPPGFNYYAYFSILPPISFLDTDIRGWVPPFDTEIVWTMPVINADGITSEVSWDNLGLPPEGSFFLEESTHGLNVNMRTQSSVQFTGNAQVVIRYLPFVCVTYEFPVQGGAWYLISLPVVPEDNSLNVLFPPAIAAFGWDYATQSYIPVNALDPGRAYWLLLLQDATIEVCGQPFETYTNNYDQQGWDMIGAVFETSEVVDDPDGSVLAMFGWDALTQSYLPVFPLEAAPKQGYWVLVFGVPSSITLGGGLTSTAKFAGGDLASFYKTYGQQPPAPPYELAGELPSTLPEDYGLAQNYPNPFNPETLIEYQLPKTGPVSLKVYTILGQEVRTLVDGEKQAGYHRVIWDGKNDAGQRLASGVYLYRIQVDDPSKDSGRTFVQTKKVVLLK
ncbi:MAG: S8 family serine peptidase [bacterium]